MCYFEQRTRARHEFFWGVQAVKHKVVSTASFNQQRFQVPEMEKHNRWFDIGDEILPRLYRDHNNP